MNKKMLLMLLAVAAAIWGNAQPLPTLIKNAQRAASEGHLGHAAAWWERAGRLKNADPDLLYKAAEAYAQVRDYEHAADCYKVCLGDARFPLAPLRFARTLKQQGRYEEASKVFEDFAQQYQGAFRAVMVAVAENELAGCAIAMQMAEKKDTTLRLTSLGDSLNTPENEFAPIPFTDKLLYFSLAADARTQLMRAKRKSKVWGQAEEAKALPGAASARFRSGCFSPDGTRFYYAQGEGSCSAESGNSARSSACVLYCLRRTEEGWSAPERLRPYINLEGSTAMFPHVAHAHGMELLYFSSDRAGGFGGLDLYVCSRPLDADDLDFSFPQNLGRAVNTGADEVCPFYDSDSNTLWFSSLGHPSLGGMDVFKSENEHGTWTKPQNAGWPINSPADDYFFVLKKRGEGAFFSSNRRQGDQKTHTTDDDLFELDIPK